MNASLVLMSKLLSMMLVAAVGFVTIRTGLLEERDCRQMAKLSLYVLSPCLIIKAFQVDLTAERLRGYLAALVFAILVHAFFILLAGILRRTGFVGLVEELSLIYTNCGNLIMPIVSMTLGENMVFYSSAYQLVYNVLFWTHGAARIRESGSIEWKKVLLNPNIIAILAGILLLVTRIRIPEVLDTSIEMLAGMVGPACMLVIGMTLAGSSFREMLTLRQAWLVAALRLIVFPLAALLALRASGFCARFPEYVPVLRVSFMAVAAPPGSNVAQLAILHDREPVRAGIYNMLAMLFCMFTIPFIDMLYALMI